jgi:hypothetical protein
MRDKLKSRSGPGVLLGDLNVNGRKTETSSQEDSEEYQKMMTIFRVPSASGTALTPHDLLKEDFGGQPVTYGDVFEEDEGRGGRGGGGKKHPSGEQPKETVLTHPEDLCTRQRLDYIILFEPLRNPGISRNDSHSSIDDEGGDSDHTSSSSSNSSLSTNLKTPSVTVASPATTCPTSSFPADLSNGGYTLAGVTPPPEKRFFKGRRKTHNSHLSFSLSSLSYLLFFHLPSEIKFWFRDDKS